MEDWKSIPRLARSTALRYFSTVAEAGSFRGAAEQLHIAASAINRQITNLEMDLGVQLFERSRGPVGLRLTEAGKILRFRLRSAMNELRIASEEIVALQGLQRGHVTVGVNDGMEINLLPNAIHSFRGLYPNITYGIKVDHTRAILEMLKQGEIDLAVGYSFPRNEDLLFHSEVTLKMYLLTPLGHHLANRSEITLADLEGADLILPDHSLLLRQTIDTALENQSTRIDPVIETNSIRLIWSLVGRDVGVGIVTGQEDRGTRQERYEYVKISDGVLPTGLIACCTLANRNLSVAAEAFIASISMAMEKSFGTGALSTEP
jgi:DNA-binding transcriptional LysR family regulator